ncbi:hypothetical protein CEUSTIGMA_g8486.t1 [Chlamydomonas eustigma]|uniref:Thioredoxin domain-containing protein n=1 Tax=Chlamydomonas eustigma TaxID=1157962 RepID=A0A250XDA2_9CHLO|nr:hypothetical protein CEUSTIGMA_g8486.t1 [Chlamydomonas eustigma]|eukprot:GAX81051.1 hypothetical protein CEUSTIGMA_g8486.t1 [Chlamydomonas eustigma]
MMERFKMFDVDGNGVIDREELRTLLESSDNGTAVPLLAQHWIPESELDRVLEKYDKNQNGTIEFDEFRDIVYDGLLLSGTLAEYEEAFKAVDKSGNGTIGATELMQLFKNLGSSVSYEKLVEVMQFYDKDESGQIEFGEFLLMFRDQMLDLKEILNYVTSSPHYESSSGVAESAGERSSGQLLEAKEGDLSLIFSEEELSELLSQKDKLTMLMCATTWCRPCKAMQRPVERMAQHYKNSFNFVKLFGNSNEKTKELFKHKLQVRSTPCFMIFNGSSLLYTQTGSNKEKLEDAVRSFISEEAMPKGRLYFCQN